MDTKTARVVWTVAVLLGAAGGLLGYGDSGTLQGLCWGAGMGLISPLIFLLVLFVLSRM